MAIYCMQCGTQLPDEAGFCFKCGKSVAAPPPLSEEEQQKRFLEALRKNDVQTAKELLTHNRHLVQMKEYGGQGILYAPLYIAAIEKSSKPLTQLLLEFGADATETSSDGMTLLHKVKSAPIATLLIQHGADVNAWRTSSSSYQNEATPLHDAVYENRLDIVRLLLDNGARINLQGSLRETPLHIAARTENLEMVQLLVERKADINMQTGYGKTTLMLVWHPAGSAKDKAIAAYLRSKGATGFGDPYSI